MGALERKSASAMLPPSEQQPAAEAYLWDLVIALHPLSVVVVVAALNKQRLPSRQLLVQR